MLVRESGQGDDEGSLQTVGGVRNSHVCNIRRGCKCRSPLSQWGHKHRRGMWFSWKTEADAGGLGGT